MQEGAGQPTGSVKWLSQVACINSRPSPRQTIADQSILRYAMLPASPMPLFICKLSPHLERWCLQDVLKSSWMFARFFSSRGDIWYIWHPLCLEQDWKSVLRWASLNHSLKPCKFQKYQFHHHLYQMHKPEYKIHCPKKQINHHKLQIHHPEY